MKEEVNSCLYCRSGEGRSYTHATYASCRPLFVKYTIECRANLEIAMNSMERLTEYSELEQEPAFHGAVSTYGSDGPGVDASWPARGEISASSACVRYAAASSLVLRDLSFRLPSHTKTGVVGRTGAGKSTLTLALLRMVPTDSGQFFIDGIDINLVRLERLRAALTIVPQDPALFKGTVRSNLDMHGTLPDAELLATLRRVQLNDMTLEHDVADTGSNLSVGERQLLCLARALLRDTKILIMDEATANVDSVSDAHIQHVIRHELHSKTVVTIAHRLRTIIFYDNVMVLDKGSIKEFAPPPMLLADEDSTFYSMCAATGDLEGLREEAAR